MSQPLAVERTLGGITRGAPYGNDRMPTWQRADQMPTAQNSVCTGLIPDNVAGPRCSIFQHMAAAHREPEHEEDTP